MFAFSEDKNRYYTRSGLCTKGNCARMYSLHDRVIVGIMYECQHSNQTREYHSTKKLRKHVCQLILVCTTQRFQTWSTTIPECRRDHHGSCTSTAWSRKSVCTLCHPRASSCSPCRATSQFSRIFAMFVAFALLLALLLAVMIRPS